MMQRALRLSLFRDIPSLDAAQRRTFIACFLGWSLDAFDFFLVTFVVSRIAHDFTVQIATVTLAITLTLAMRWVGALIFGWFADRYGRKIPLMVDIIFYSLMEVLTAFSPNFTWFLIFRALYGIGMGGEWGLGAALALETVPDEARGFYSGVLQQGYAFGYLLAALAYFVFFPHVGWRGLFVIGVLPAFVVLLLRKGYHEPPRQDARAEPLTATPKPTIRAVPATNTTRRARPSRFRSGPPLPLKPLGEAPWIVILYAILLMAAFNFMSHGTQDLYPTFLQVQRGLKPGGVTALVVIYNIGAIIGGTLFGAFSQHWGRRRAIIVAALGGLLMIPLWVFPSPLVLLATGAFLMQFFAQGAWGVIPAYLNEISPRNARGTIPGFVYQLGNLISAPAATVEAAIAVAYFHADYSKALAIIALCVFVAVIAFTLLGAALRIREHRSLTLSAVKAAREQ